MALLQFWSLLIRRSLWGGWGVLWRVLTNTVSHVNSTRRTVVSSTSYSWRGTWYWAWGQSHIYVYVIFFSFLVMISHFPFHNTCVQITHTCKHSLILAAWHHVTHVFSYTQYTHTSLYSNSTHTSLYWNTRCCIMSRDIVKLWNWYCTGVCIHIYFGWKQPPSYAFQIQIYFFQVGPCVFCC